MEPIPAEELAAAKKLQEAIDLLKSAKEDEARKVATGIIQDQLNSQFDRDVEQREKELVEVERRVKTLREQLDKRKSLRDDIIGLRLKTILNDAEGLGFPGGGSADDSILRGQVSGPGPTYERRERDLLDADRFEPFSAVPANERATVPALDESAPQALKRFQSHRDDTDVLVPYGGDAPIRGDSDEIQIDTDVIRRLIPRPRRAITSDDYRSLIRFLQVVQNQRDGYKFETAFLEIRKILDTIIDPDEASIRDDAFVRVIAWAKDRSKENGKLEGFALLRWYYEQERWTEILEAVRKLDPALANETDALLAPFLKPKAEASTDNQKQKVGDDLSDESPKS
jgi:hypothetical protein